jgi:hypothetical protein
MTKPNRWTVESIFASCVGLAMAVFLAGACVVGQRAPTAGSELVPAAVLEKLVAQGRICQTVTEDQVFQPRRHC